MDWVRPAACLCMSMRGNGLAGDRYQGPGFTPGAIDQAVAAAQDELRIAERHADAGDEGAVVRAAVVSQERQRIRGEAATTGRETYDPDRNLALQRAQRAQRTARTSPTALAMPPSRPGRPPTSRDATSPAPPPTPLHLPRPRRAPQAHRRRPPGRPGPPPHRALWPARDRGTSQRARVPVGGSGANSRTLPRQAAATGAATGE